VIATSPHFQLRTVNRAKASFAGGAVARVWVENEFMPVGVLAQPLVQGDRVAYGVAAQ
jgi:hypothetical protein